MTREEFLKQAALLAYRWGAGDSMGAAALDVASLADQAGLAWDPPTTEQLDDMLAGQPPPAAEEIWQSAPYHGRVFRQLANGIWQEKGPSDSEWGSYYLTEQIGSVLRQAAERAEYLSASPYLTQYAAQAPPAEPEVLRDPVPTHPAFRQMALVLGRLEAAYLAAREAGVETGSLEGREGGAKGCVIWPCMYNKPPDALRVSVEARVPEGREEESDGQ